MKKISLIIFFILYFLKIYADENQTNSRNILDLSYFPNAGKVFVIPSLSFISTSSSIDILNVLNDRYADVESKSLDAGFEIGYGLTDYIAFSLSNSYYLKDSTSTTFYDDAKVTEESEGLTDPDLTIGYRAYEGYFICDLYAAYSPELIDAKSSTDNKKGTEGRGGAAFDLGLALGKFINQNEINFELTYSIISPREVKDAEDGTQTEIIGDHEFAASLNVQHRNDDFAINLGLGYIHTFWSETSSKSDDSGFKIDPTNTYFISAGLLYAIINQQLAISADYGYGITYAYNMKSKDKSASPVVFTNNESRINVFNISTIFQF